MKSIYILILSLSLFACKHQNHIDKYGLEIDSLNKLPDNFYAHHRGRVFIDNNENIIWFNLDSTGNIKNIHEISTTNKALDHRQYTKEDSINLKENATEFIRLSRKYKFGHIHIDRKNKISFSHKEDLPEQYVVPLNDSVKALYSANKDFELLDNGWFENQR